MRPDSLGLTMLYLTYFFSIHVQAKVYLVFVKYLIATQQGKKETDKD